MIIVDELIAYPQKPHGHLRWCHMATDDHTLAGLAELHLMAWKLGLRRSWFQNKPRFLHYDLTPPKRQLAIENGAQTVTWREMPTRGLWPAPVPSPDPITGAMTRKELQIWLLCFGEQLHRNHHNAWNRIIQHGFTTCSTVGEVAHQVEMEIIQLGMWRQVGPVLWQAIREVLLAAVSHTCSIREG